MNSGVKKALFTLYIPAVLSALVQAVLVDPLPQSWFFDIYKPSDLSAPLLFPVVRQCDTLTIQWQTDGASGPKPSPPYSLTVLSSAYNYPITLDAGDGNNVDFLVTSPPQNQFDSEGHSGGCQRMYSVIGSDSAAPCDNSSLPDPPAYLDVKASDEDGALTSDQDGPAQCTDVVFEPQNGTSPYSLTILPPAHPPYNVTSHGGGDLDWTVALSASNVFWAFVTDSSGAQWLFPEPIRVSEGEDTLCLSGRT
ncbi:hypothetical protein HDZ31DRAFT_66966 [Schizophyllum fasciatum]